MTPTQPHPEDRTLLGEGRYPDTGPLAVLARLAFLAAIVAIVITVFLPPEIVPHFARSQYLEHFAAFYVAALFAFAALPRTPLRRIATGFVMFGLGLESTHLLAGAALGPLIDNWVADMGGLSAAAAPVVVERFRRRFPRLRPPTNNGPDA
jgi:hypothetical protein